MYPVSDRFLDVITGSHPVATRALLLTSRQFGAAPTGTELPILDGDVKLASTADVKATIELTIPGDYWDVVQPYAAELWVARGVRFGDGTSELVPLGYFRVDSVEQDNAPYGPIRLTGSDRNAAIIQNRVLYPYQVPDGTTHRTIFERLVNGRVTPDANINTAGYSALATVPIPITWTGYDPDRATVDGGQVVEDSTYDFLSKIADAKDCVLRFDEHGELIVDLRDRDPDAPAIYSILPGRIGNLIKASRKTNRDGVYNIVSAYGSDPASPTGYQLAYNGNPNSPLAWYGLFGPSPRYYASPLLRTPPPPAEAAPTILSRYTGLPTTVGLWTVPNPALRPLDTISAQVTGLPEKHLIDEVTIPLAGSDPVEIATKTVNQVIIPEAPTTGPAPTPGPDPTTDPVFATVGAAHNIGSQPGQNHFNVGVGFDGSQTGTFATYGKTHHDFGQSEIEAGLNIPGFYEMDNGRPLLTCHPGGGKTSSNTKYPRVEYRELEQDGKTKMAFVPKTGTHYVKGRSAVEAPLAAAKPQAVLAQMHNASDDTAMIYVNNSTTILAKVNGTSIGTLDSAFRLGTEYDWMIKVVDGVIQFYWGDLSTPKLTSNAFTSVSAGQYFKAGDYMQWNLDNGDATLCKVHLISLEHWHSQTPLSSSPWPQPARPSTAGGGTGGSTSGGTSGTADDGVEAAKLLNWGPVIDGDEFNYVGAPNSRWEMYDGPGHDGNGIRSPGAFAVNNGILTCTGDNVNGGTTGGMAFGGRSSKYWRLEWRVRLYSINPAGKGHRYHGVLILWPDSDAWPQGGEDDFYECDAEDGSFTAYIHIPGNDPSGQHAFENLQPLDLQNWHNIAFERSRSGVTCWIDGQQAFKVTDPKIQVPGPLHATFQLDNFFGSNMEPAKFEAKFLRIYASPS